MPEKTIEEILEELYQQGLSHGRIYGYQDYSVPYASRAIRQLIKEELGERLPKEQDVLEHHEKYHLNCHRCIEILTHNQALTDCKFAIAEYLGEGER